MSKIEVDQVDPQSSTNLTIGTSGDTIKTGTGTSLVVQGDGSSANGIITLNCSQNSHGVKISSPDHSGGQSYTMKLPATNITAGKFLKVDSITGSGATAIGQLSFADAGGGKIGQVLQTVKTDTQTGTSSNSWTDISGLSQAITPSASTSKILILIHVNASADINNHIGLRILRGSTAIHVGTDGTNTGRNVLTGKRFMTDDQYHADLFAAQFLDSPNTTSATTYKVQINGNDSYYVNRSQSNTGTNTVQRPRSVSGITVMEVLA